MVDGRPDWCTIHQCSMMGQQGQYGFFYSHETTDERYPVKSNGKRYCQGKPPKTVAQQSGGSQADRDKAIRARAPQQFFATLQEWNDYVFLNKKPGGFNPMESESQQQENPPLGFPPEEEPPF